MHVDGSEIRRENHPGMHKTIVNNGINYQPQQVSQISEPSTVVMIHICPKKSSIDWVVATPFHPQRFAKDQQGKIFVKSSTKGSVNSEAAAKRRKIFVCQNAHLSLVMSGC